jgi:hypothetical protein
VNAEDVAIPGLVSWTAVTRVHTEVWRSGERGGCRHPRACIMDRGAACTRGCVEEPRTRRMSPSPGSLHGPRRHVYTRRIGGAVNAEDVANPGLVSWTAVTRVHAEVRRSRGRGGARHPLATWTT